MSAAAKRKGTRNEHRSRAILEAAGYRCTRSGGSLGEWDLIGVGAADVVLVQCKTRDWPGTLEMRTLAEFPAPPNVRKLVHRWRDRQRFPDARDVV
jgi:Holliday junction resolvase-like predicted endonuclease